MTIIGHGYGSKQATPISHGYGKQVAGATVFFGRSIWNDMAVSDSVVKPMAVNCGTEKFNGGT